MSVAKVTSRGRITIPKSVRDALGISEQDYIIIVPDGDKAILRPVHRRELLDLRGSLPATRPYPGTDAIRDEIGRKILRSAQSDTSEETG